MSRAQCFKRPCVIIGHIGVAAPVESEWMAVTPTDSEIITAVLTLRRAILHGSSGNLRAIQGELAYLRRHARRQMRRAAS
jgi:hypothetical protein